jgi:hypothetical protein
VYAWFFRASPSGVPTADCVRCRDLSLLYVGISPSARKSRDGIASRQTLWNRVRYHYRGNAEGSTLRLTLGCLLSEKLGIELRRVGSGQRMTFGVGEHALSQWLNDNAFVAWVTTDEPEALESHLIRTVPLPLNLDQSTHAFAPAASAMRSAARERARRLPVL